MNVKKLVHGIIALPQQTTNRTCNLMKSSSTVPSYRRIFKGSAVKRAKYEGLIRNISAVTDADKADTH
jgi:hypothetical protein